MRNPPSEPAQPLVAARGLTKSYPTAAGRFLALDDLDLTIARGEFVAIAGQSGSGKSTLLNLLAGIDRPTSGEIAVDGVRVHTLSERDLSAWRGTAVGIVFQFFQLLPTLTACENVMLPMDFCNTWARNERRDRAIGLLERLGVADQADKPPTKLSGGQQQRVAVARALANDAPLLLADEPTGNLDSRTASGLLELLGSLAQEGRTVVMVTHEPSAMKFAGRTIHLADGRVIVPETPAYA